MFMQAKYHKNKAAENLEQVPDNVAQTPFAKKVYAIVAKIPEGKVLTYKQVAAKAGRPGAFRAVGTILSKNWDPNVFCHRVIRSDGRLGNYNRTPEEKERLLRKEGFLS